MDGLLYEIIKIIMNGALISEILKLFFCFSEKKNEIFLLSIRGSLSRAKPRGDTTEPRNGLEDAEINKRHNIVDRII